MSPSLRRNLKIAAALAVVLVAGAFGYDRWRAHEARGQFGALLSSAQGSLDQVRTSPIRDRTHLAAGQSYGYGTSVPTAGPHDPAPTSPGFYDYPQPLTKLVHALEHGHVVIYYDEPGGPELDMLKGWTRLFRGPWDGLVVVPHRGLNRKVVMTAWRKRLDLEPFDASRAARFIDAYRGRGPENPVR